MIDRTASAKVVLVRVTGANSYGCRMQMGTSKKPPRAGGVQGEKGCVDRVCRGRRVVWIVRGGMQTVRQHARLT